MNSNILGICLFLFSLQACNADKVNNAAVEEWQSLFNKKNLEGWDVKIAGYALNKNFNNTFKVEDSVIKVSYTDYDKFTNEFGHLYYNQPFSYYRLRLQYRFTGKQLEGGPGYAYLNSGVMLHSEPANSLGINQSFPVSIEMQFLASDSIQQRYTGNLCTPGTEVSMNGKKVDAHCIDSKSKHYQAGQWITAEAVVLGDSIVHHIIEGDTVLTYESPSISGFFVNETMTWTSGGFSDSVTWIQRQGTLLKEGYIALQAESHPIEFRNIEVLNFKGCMDPKAVNYKSYYVKSDPQQCKYK